MEKQIGTYESVFIVNTTLGEEAVAGLVNKIKVLIEANGTIETFDEWGKRRLAYEINKMNEGYYVLVSFKSGLDFPAELDRIYKITDGIIRWLVIKKD